MRLGTCPIPRSLVADNPKTAAETRTPYGASRCFA